MYAVMQTGGKQYRVTPGDVIYVEKLDAPEGAVLDFDVLLYQDNEKVTVGTPVLEGVKVEGKVLGHGKGQKVVVFKFKAKKNYRKKQGHRQPYTRLEIIKITG